MPVTPKTASERIAAGNAALDRAIEAAMPLANEISDKLIGHNALVSACLAAHLLRLHEHTIAEHGVTPPRAGVLTYISRIADRLALRVDRVSTGN